MMMGKGKVVLLKGRDSMPFGDWKEVTGKEKDSWMVYFGKSCKEWVDKKELEGK